MTRPLFFFNLFWRTFALLAVLIAGTVFAWQLTFRALEAEPRALEAAQQLAGLVNLSRVALQRSDPINRVAVVRSLQRGDTIRVRVAEPTDRWLNYEVGDFGRQLGAELRRHLGEGTVVARSVNEEAGLWVRFTIGQDAFWLQTSPAPLSVSFSSNGWWILIALMATFIGSAVIAGLINKPLRELSVAAGRIRGGEYDSRLDETTLTSEIREVNMGFNRMARELAKLEEDRAVMLAGISHDLRTPLARLRLETEMSVADEQARHFMAQDIDQLDAIIDKFMDYARPNETQLRAVFLHELVEREAQGFRNPEQIRFQLHVPATIKVFVDEIELGRVLLNLFENARRYGRHPGEPALVEVSAARQHAWVELRVRDHGPGVPADRLARLTTPFYRGDAARTAASGAGLGLAIVEKSIQRMGGELSITNAESGGLITVVRLQPA